MVTDICKELIQNIKIQQLFDRIAADSNLKKKFVDLGQKVSTQTDKKQALFNLLNAIKEELKNPALKSFSLDNFPFPQEYKGYFVELNDQMFAQNSKYISAI